MAFEQPRLRSEAVEVGRDHPALAVRAGLRPQVVNGDEQYVRRLLRRRAASAQEHKGGGSRAESVWARHAEFRSGVVLRRGVFVPKGLPAVDILHELPAEPALDAEMSAGNFLIQRG